MGSSESQPGRPRPYRRSRGNWLIAVLAGLTVLLGIGVMVVPVVIDDPVVSWPKAGSAAMSTVVPLSPYRPLSFEATVPCATLRALAGSGGTALATYPGGGPGLYVRAQQGGVRFWVSGVVVLDEPLRPEPCVYRLRADSNGVRVWRDGTELVSRRDLLPPQVSELSTQADGQALAGLAVTLHTDARYQSRPSGLKIALLVAHVLALASLLVLAWRRWRGRQSMRGLRVPRPSAADAVMLAVAVAWLFLGPANMDDSWYMMMARNAGQDGYIGNFVYMFNVTENPFVLSQYVLQFWGELGGWSLWWMRLVPTICGLLTWVLLRVLLATVLGRAATLRAVPWALLVAHLVWYLPYGTTLRPEPFIVLCAAATLVFAEAAALRHSIGAFAVAVVFAALAVTCSPSGLVAAAPLVLSTVWLVPALRRQPWSGRVAVASLLAAAATVAVPVGFADATLGDVIEASRVHDWYYLSFAWYEEFVHYKTLLDTAGWARRLPVLLTLAIVVVVAIASGRGGVGRDPIRRLVVVSTITSALALALLSFSPTKWVNHFHAVAAAPTVLLAAALLRSPLPRRAGAVVTSVSVLLVVGAVSLSFAGSNYWVPFTDAGQRFGHHLDIDPMTNNMAPHFGPVYLRNPLLWIGVALVAFGWARWRRGSGKLVRLLPDRAVLASASIGSVLLMVALFGYAPIAQAPGWTVARSGVQTLFGHGCGLASDVTVKLPSPGQLAAPATRATLTGDFVNSRPVPIPGDPWPAPTTVWHDDQPDGATPGTGGLTTGWYPLPASTTATHVTVPLAGRLAGQDLRVQFGRGGQVTGEETLQPDVRRPIREWQQLSVPLPSPRPEAVRVVAVDRVTGADSWIAVAEPKLTEPRSVNEVTRGQPVLANHMMTALWPCVDQVGIRNGLTDTPTVHLTTDENLPTEWPYNISNVSWGGAWAETAAEWTQVDLDADLPGGPPRLPWGHVFLIRYRYPVGLFDVHVDHGMRSGLTRLPTLANNDYPSITRNPGMRA
ncbi:arabinosyltransferase domain-containing protein [Gandjariella thermophila]|uniref:Putative arabinosyltransferase C n=1 Tax=Gandjariella thermophila TaxID=1931992 RepID=A0A4D4JF59_9PSEU|nr:arabinosyltransferase domain-containing protein [Gandjariella thermophila]GDY34052.1 putative arabinosyltransferase C [Gandjariella thermophila]